MNTTPRLLPIGPTARRFKIPTRWLRAEAESGRIPCLRADKALLFDLDTVEAVLLKRAQQGQGGAK